MRVCSFLYSDSLLYTSFFFFLFYMVFIHVIVHEYIRHLYSDAYVIRVYWIKPSSQYDTGTCVMEVA